MAKKVAPNLPKRPGRGQLLRGALVKQGLLGDATNSMARVTPNQGNTIFIRGGRRAPPP